MRKVYKYKLAHTTTLDDYIEVDLPVGFEPLCVKQQHQGNIQLWCLVDSMSPMETRTFRIAGTGHPIEEKNPQHIDTFFLNELQLVFHVFLVD